MLYHRRDVYLVAGFYFNWTLSQLVLDTIRYDEIWQGRSWHDLIWTYYPLYVHKCRQQTRANHRNTPSSAPLLTTAGLVVYNSVGAMKESALVNLRAQDVAAAAAAATTGTTTTEAGNDIRNDL